MEKKIHKPILENLPFAYAMHKIILDNEGKPCDYEYIEVNNAFETFTGFKKEYIVGRNVTEVLPNIKASKFNWIEYYGNIAINGGESEFEQFLEELQKWYKVKVFSPILGYFITFFIDITHEIQEKNLYRSILSSLEEGLISTDTEGNITMINEAAKRLTGFSKVEFLNHNISIILDRFKDEDSAELKNNVNLVLNQGPMLKNREVSLSLYQDGMEEQVNFLYSMYPIKNQNDSIDGIVISFLDITDNIKKKNKIDYITYHDSLTEVYNRTYFTNEIRNIDREELLPLSVIMGDVNGLKLTNDAFGHLLGDELLVSAANVMKNSCRENDRIIRWGGDEFIILLPNTDEDQVQRISDRIKTECEKVQIGSINLSISLGYATKYNIKEDIMQIINESEENMYRVKMIESSSQKSKTLKVITQTLQEKSILDAKHSRNVSIICKLIGKSINMSKKETSELAILGDIHDIGKVAIDEQILNKASCLNDEEWKEIKRHSEIGYHIALSSPELSFLAKSILDHHEKYDGTGYPKGLLNENIPLYARILSVADAFDSMVSYRPYRKSKSKEEAIEELIKNKGKQFDPKIVDAFLEHVVDNSWINETYFNIME